MSASTVSITANPTARRRSVVIGDKKPGIEFAVEVAPGTAATSVGGGDDHSHSIRGGDAVVERSRDAFHVKKALPASATTALPASRGVRTSRKGVPKSEKPRWQTVISVFTKNLLVLLFLAVLVQMIRRLAANSSGNSSGSSSSTGGSEFEGRIAEVEAFVKTTTKMMQVQMDAVDRKFGNEIGGLRTELKKIEEKSVEFGGELRKLDGRTEGLEKSLAELSSAEWLSKEDLDKFFEEFKKVNKGVDQGDVNLDEIRAIARGIVEKEIEKHAADGLGRVDYALASAGAMVVKHSEPYAIGKGSPWIYNTNRNKVHRDAATMLEPSFGEPGQCFPLRGSSGFLHIKLRTAIIPEAVTLEHVAKSVAYDRSSAPKDCRVSGWLQGADPASQVDDAEKMFRLTEFTYDLDKSNAQTFNVLDSAGSGIVNMIRLDFTSNHGSPSHTCIYRLRVHGREPESVSLAAQSS